MARKPLTLAFVALALTAPGASAQAPDVARGTATLVSGLETTTYELEASSGPLGAGAVGFITRAFVGPGGNSLAVADVTCVAAEGNRAIVIGRIRPGESVNVGYESILIRIYDGTPELQPDAVMTAVNPQVGSEVTFTNCEAFLPPFPFITEQITAGDFQVIDGGEVEPPPPPPPPCDDDDDGGGDDGDDDGGDDGGGDDDCDDDDGGDG